MARRKVTLSLEQDLWRRMKAACAMRGTNVSTVVEALMRQWLEDPESTTPVGTSAKEHL